MIRRVLALVLTGGCLMAASEREMDWRRLATGADRTRLRDWRDAWMAAGAKARGSGGGEAMTAHGRLLDPDAALTDPLPPVGEYRCRVVKLGARAAGMTPVTVLGPVACSVERLGTYLHFVVRTGAQRPAGEMFADGRLRGVFLGTLVLGDERRPMIYGRDHARDMAGLIERVGERRWRIVLPYPRFESTLDVIELVPDQ